MSIWLLSLLASFVLILAMGTIIWWRQYQLAQKREDKRCAPVAAPALARITSIKSASRRPNSNLSANAIAADTRSAK